MSGSPAARGLLQTIGGSMFYQPRDEDLSAVQTILNDRLIQPIKQGKLTGYALTAAGYQRWLGHHQTNELA